MIRRYLHRLYHTIISRGYVEVERLDEVVLLRDEQLVKLRYAYHYQDRSGEPIFRYDNAPHHPNIPTYPHHKHVGSAVVPAQVPDLSEILREIEQIIFDDK